MLRSSHEVDQCVEINLGRIAYSTVSGRVELATQAIGITHHNATTRGMIDIGLDLDAIRAGSGNRSLEIRFVFDNEVMVMEASRQLIGCPE